MLETMEGTLRPGESEHAGSGAKSTRVGLLRVAVIRLSEPA